MTTPARTGQTDYICEVVLLNKSRKHVAIILDRMTSDVCFTSKARETAEAAQYDGERWLEAAATTAEDGMR
jgi:hypothetical protein